MTVLLMTLKTAQRALDVCVTGGATRQAYFDRQLGALVIRESLPLILTENAKVFTGIEGITSVDPFV